MPKSDRVTAKRVKEMLFEHFSKPDFELTFQERGDLLYLTAKFFESHDDTGRPFAVQDIEPCPVDCGDNSCLVAWPKGGMRTNGGCRCFKHLSSEDRIKTHRAVNYWRKRAENAEAAVKPKEE